MKQRRLTLTLTKGDESLYIGDILRWQLHLSAAVIRRIKWLEDGILLDGIRVPTRHHGKEGQVLSALIGESHRSGHIPSVKGNLTLLHEDEDFLVVNKESGVVVHPTRAHKEDTLGNFILFYYDQIGFNGDFHPVHRLDKGTSGILVVAKHPFAQEQFKGQLHSPIFHREYLALVWGTPHPASGTISAPILLKEGIQRCVHPEGVHAVTHYETLSTGTLEGNALSLVAVTLETGRTHQIRVHFSHLGHPLLGDEIYGEETVLSHTALHSFRLSLQQPVTGEDMVFLAKPPADVLEVMEQAGIPLPPCFT